MAHCCAVVVVMLLIAADSCYHMQYKSLDLLSLCARPSGLLGRSSLALVTPLMHVVCTAELRAKILGITVWTDTGGICCMRATETIFPLPARTAFQRHALGQPAFFIVVFSTPDGAVSGCLALGVRASGFARPFSPLSVVVSQAEGPLHSALAASKFRARGTAVAALGFRRLHVAGTPPPRSGYRRGLRVCKSCLERIVTIFNLSANRARATGKIGDRLGRCRAPGRAPGSAQGLRAVVVKHLLSTKILCDAAVPNRSLLASAPTNRSRSSRARACSKSEWC